MSDLLGGFFSMFGLFAFLAALCFFVWTTSPSWPLRLVVIFGSIWLFYFFMGKQHVFGGQGITVQQVCDSVIQFFVKLFHKI